MLDEGLLRVAVVVEAHRPGATRGRHGHALEDIGRGTGAGRLSPVQFWQLAADAVAGVRSVPLPQGALNGGGGVQRCANRPDRLDFPVARWTAGGA